MDKITFDLSKDFGKFKPLNAVNNGPDYNRHSSDQLKTNFKEYKAARIPYARNHDAAFWSTYDGEHSVDVMNIFPDFDADPESPESYDFILTDDYIMGTLEAGTETYYRLGHKIEHEIKKYGTLPPKDFKKWAVICEHIIRHMNEGWADGHNFNITYWEIWNEPDLDPDDAKNKRTWGGTKAQFFDLFEITAKHLKACFPNLKIGGPALACDEKWAEEFLCEMQKRNVPIDFFSWHIYTARPEHIIERADILKVLLVKYGYGDAESILNEWNYIRGWEEDFVYSIETIIGAKGAAFATACIALAQPSSIDMLMYYDARPCSFNGMFDFYTMKPLKTYYPYMWYGNFYDCEKYVKAENDIDGIYTICGVYPTGKTQTIISYYCDIDDCTDEKMFSLDFGKDGEYEIYLVDETHNGELVKTTSDLAFSIKPNSCVLVKEI